MITEKDVVDIQEKWGDGIIKISNSYNNGKDYKQEAILFISNFYAYDEQEVLFKPTLASQFQFRKNKESALSYFIGNNSSYSEDTGFAIKGWQKVRWERAGIKIFNDIAISMGNYFFLDSNNTELKVEFSFVYKLDDLGKLKIILHDSHLPYSN